MVPVERNFQIALQSAWCAEKLTVGFSHSSSEFNCMYGCSITTWCFSSSMWLSGVLSVWLLCCRKPVMTPLTGVCRRALACSAWRMTMLLRCKNQLRRPACQHCLLRVIFRAAISNSSPSFKYSHTPSVWTASEQHASNCAKLLWGCCGLHRAPAYLSVSKILFEREGSLQLLTAGLLKQARSEFRGCPWEFRLRGQVHLWISVAHPTAILATTREQQHYVCFACQLERGLGMLVPQMSARLQLDRDFII